MESCVGTGGKTGDTWQERGKGGPEIMLPRERAEQQWSAHRGCWELQMTFM